MDYTLSDAVVDAELATRARMCTGGCISLYEGPRPEKVDEPVGAAKLLGMSDPLQIVPAGKRLFGVRCTFREIMRRGKAEWYRAFSREGKALFDGSLPWGTFEDETTGEVQPENLVWPGLTLHIDITQEGPS